MLSSLGEKLRRLRLPPVKNDPTPKNPAELSIPSLKDTPAVMTPSDLSTLPQKTNKTDKTGKKGKREEFKDNVIEEYWNKAEKVPGQDPSRWRQDPAGNYLFYPFRGKEGLHGYAYDHIDPASQHMSLKRRGPGTVQNCQVLQTAVNRAKTNKTSFSKEQMVQASKKFDFKGCINIGKDDLSCTIPDEKYMDGLEIAMYGDVQRPGRNCKAFIFAEMIGNRGIDDMRARCANNPVDDQMPVRSNKTKKLHKQRLPREDTPPEPRVPFEA